MQNITISKSVSNIRYHKVPPREACVLNDHKSLVTLLGHMREITYAIIYTNFREKAHGFREPQ